MPRGKSQSKSRSSSRAAAPKRVAVKVTKDAPRRSTRGSSTQKSTSKAPAKSTSKTTAKDVSKSPATRGRGASKKADTKPKAGKSQTKAKATKTGRGGRGGSKKQADPSDEEEEEQEEEKKPARGARGRGASKKQAPAPKGKGRGRSSSTKSAAKDEEEDEEEDTKKTTKKGAKSTKSKTATKAASKAAGKGRGRGSKAKAKDEEEEEEEEEEKPKNGKRGRGKSQTKDLEDEADGASDSKKKKKLDLKNIEVHVDEHCPRSADLRVYIKGDKIYDSKLNQSNVNANNNKFYIIQLLQHTNNTKSFYVFNRWGRVGVDGQTKFTGPMDETKAIKEYEKKLHEKSVRGDYRVLDMDYSKDDPVEDESTKAKNTKGHLSTSTLKKQVADLINLIFDTTMATKQMESDGYDSKKMPLGKLSKDNIQKGYGILKDLLEAIQKKKSRNHLAELSNDFYSYIPHNVGFSNMSSLIITTEEVVKKKLDLLDSLSNVRHTYELMKQGGAKDNVIDSNYSKLKCDIQHLDKSSKEYKSIEKFINNTNEGSKVNILNMYSIEREGEIDRYTKNLPNKTLLWHGSRLSNFVGILSQGLRIAPPEAPSSGYRFGKGIYLADMFSKSHGYCASYGSDGVFCIMLCESALGTPNELLHDDFNASKLPSGKHSTKALGHSAPPPESYVELEKGIMIPLGAPKKTPHQNSSCSHNEFIIYDVKQVRIRYLIWMKDGRY